MAGSEEGVGAKDGGDLVDARKQYGWCTGESQRKVRDITHD